MAYVFKRHFTLTEAKDLLPKVIHWFEELDGLRLVLGDLDDQMEAQSEGGDDLGGANVNRRIKVLAEITGLLREFRRHGVQIKDLETGLIDFPSLRDGNEVFLCWKRGEETIEYWHDLQSGFAGRQPL
jgi:hypothetical protein